MLRHFDPSTWNRCPQWRYILFGCIVIGCNGEDARQVPIARELNEQGTLQAACAARLAGRSAVPDPDVALVVRDVRRIVLPDEIAGIDDVTALEGGSGFAVLDVRGRQVAVFDDRGRMVTRFGREGSGPGEFGFSARFDRRGGRLVAAAGHLAVSDYRSTMLFSMAGELVAQTRVDSFPEAYNIDFHSMPLPDGMLVIGTSGKYKGRINGDASVRRRIELVQLDARELRGRTTLPLKLENSWALLAPFGSFPDRRPYRDEHRRVWTVNDSLIVVYPWDTFGVCGFTLNGSVAYAFGVAAPRLKVDDAERDRVLSDVFGDPDARLPFTGERPRELFAQHWPEFGPFYTDIVASNREVWALRRVDAKTVRVDVYDVRTGYRGTFDPPGGRLPRHIAGGMAITTEADLDVAVITYALSPAP